LSRWLAVRQIDQAQPTCSSSESASWWLKKSGRWERVENHMWNDKRLTRNLVYVFGTIAVGALGLQATTSAQSTRVSAPKRVQLDAQAGAVDLAPTANLAVSAAALRTNAVMLNDEATMAAPRSRCCSPNLTSLSLH